MANSTNNNNSGKTTNFNNNRSNTTGNQKGRKATMVGSMAQAMLAKVALKNKKPSLKKNSNSPSRRASKLEKPSQQEINYKDKAVRFKRLDSK